MSKPVYILGQIQVPDLKVYFEKYAVKLKVVLDRYDGEALAGTTKADVVEGEHFGNWTVLIKFPSKEKFEECMSSDEYKALAVVRP